MGRTVMQMNLGAYLRRSHILLVENNIAPATEAWILDADGFTQVATVHSLILYW
jgi:hypothetical protein